MSKKKKAKILIYDIETAPNLAWVWGKWEQNVIRYVKEWSLLSVAWKWYGNKNVSCTTAQKGEKGLVKKVWKLFDEADMVVAHNGDQFDQKKMYARFLYYHMPPPTGFASIDTKKIAKRYFKFNSNSLDDLGEHLGLGRKVKHPGFDMWEGCMKNQPKWWKLMAKYNRQDVVLLEKVYERFLPYITNHPSVALLTDGTRDDCPNCGSTRTQSQGIRATRCRTYQRRRCLNCGSSFKSLNRR